MADILILAIAIASAVSLLIVSPCGAQRKALRALNDYWGQAPYWNGYLNERYMPGLDIHYVGDRLGTQIRWQKSRHLWFQGDYGIFLCWPLLKETQPGRNLNYWALWAGYKF